MTCLRLLIFPFSFEPLCETPFDVLKGPQVFMNSHTKFSVSERKDKECMKKLRLETLDLSTLVYSWFCKSLNHMALSI